MIRYLSLAWIDALSRQVAGSTELAALAATHDIAVTQVVTDGPEGDVTYHLRLGGGEASFGAGPADDADVCMEQSWATAKGVATGDINAQEAFLKGLIRLSGNQQKLIDSQPVFAALDAVFTAVGEQTEYR
ncbi:MAG TPA: SCP2 sterol-binding domain-containing protein [Ilumatobacteraceae bacterium]